MNDKRGFIGVIPAMIVLVVVTIGIGFLVYHVDNTIKLISNTYFLIGVGVLLTVIFYQFVGRVLMNIIYPLAQGVFAFIRSLF